MRNNRATAVGGTTKRRNFIFGAAAATAGLALGATGFSAHSQATESDDQKTADQAKETIPVAIHESDVVIVGGGISGISAAIKCRELGLSTVVLDKGIFGHSGASGINWGHMHVSSEFTSEDQDPVLGYFASLVSMNEGMLDQQYGYEVVRRAHEDIKLVALSEQMGCVNERLRDGSPLCGNAPMPYPGIVICQNSGVFPRMFAQYAKRLGTVIHERTMALDVLVDESGAACGVVAIDLVSGAAHVFRAASVIMATGSYAWACGNNGIWPYSMTGPECTGDGVAMFLRCGVKQHQMEICPPDNAAWEPFGTRMAMGVGLEQPNQNHGMNANGEYFLKDWLAENPNDGVSSKIYRLYSREIYQGRCSDTGGVYVDTTHLDEMERFYRRCREDLKRSLNWDMPQILELHVENWETYAAPAKLTLESETTVPGLFFAGSNIDNFNIPSCIATAQMSAEGAARRRQEGKRPGTDWAKAEQTLDQAYATLANDSDDPILPHDLMYKIQVTYWEGMNTLRNEEGIQRSLEALEAIRLNDLPRMTLPSHSRYFNTEWKTALEIPAMLTCTIGACHAALERRECRGPHIRTDYPQVNNEDYLKWIVVGLEGDEFTVEYQDIDTSIFDYETTKAMIPITFSMND